MLGLVGLMISFILLQFIFKHESTSEISQKLSFYEKGIKQSLRFHNMSTWTIKMGVVKQPEGSHTMSKSRYKPHSLELLLILGFLLVYRFYLKQWKSNWTQVYVTARLGSWTSSSSLSQVYSGCLAFLVIYFACRFWEQELPISKIKELLNVEKVTFIWIWFAIIHLSSST